MTMKLTKSDGSTLLLKAADARDKIVITPIENATLGTVRKAISGNNYDELVLQDSSGARFVVSSDDIEGIKRAQVGDYLECGVQGVIVARDDEMNENIIALPLAALAFPAVGFCAVGPLGCAVPMALVGAAGLVADASLIKVEKLSSAQYRTTALKGQLDSALARKDVEGSILLARQLQTAQLSGDQLLGVAEAYESRGVPAAAYPLYVAFAKRFPLREERPRVLDRLAQLMPG